MRLISSILAAALAAIAAAAAMPPPAHGTAVTPAGVAGVAATREEPALTEYARQLPLFRPCTDEVLIQANAECATLRAPLDYRRPNGETIEIAVSRIPAGDPARRRGILAFNPGGPGGAGLDYPARLRPVLGDVADRYDLIGFDPRFVGKSSPITCGPARLGDVARSAGLDRAGFVESARLSADFARRCHERNQAVLPYAGARDVARDLDLIRVVLGERRLSYYGVSWGADLGAVYSELFPHRVDRMVIDSVSAVESEYELNRAGGPRAEAALDEWAGWAAAHDGEYHLGATPARVRAGVQRLLETAARQPIDIGGYRVDDNVLPFVLRHWLSDQANDPVLARTLSVLNQAAAGRAVKPTPELAGMLDLLNLRDPMIENVMASSFAVFCADPRWPRDPAEYWRNIQRGRATEPVFGPFAHTITPCAYWRDASIEPPVRVANDVPLLMVQASRDNSPYPLALDLHRRLTGSRLVTADLRAHGLYDRRINDQDPVPCVERAINDYLAHGVLPGRDVWC